MPEPDGLLRVFWPLGLTRSTLPGVLVGWKNSELDLLVVAVLQEVEVRNVENALKVGTLFRGARHPLGRIYDLCEQPAMHVLGTVNSPPNADSTYIYAETALKRQRPHISCAGTTAVQIIMFERPEPHRMQYISLEPIALALDEKFGTVDHLPGHTYMGNSFAEDKKIEASRRLVAKLKFHTITKQHPSAKEVALSRIVNQINCAWEVHDLLQRNIALVGTRTRRTLSVSERVVESASTMKDFVLLFMWQMFTQYAYPLIRRGFVVGLMCHRVLAEILLILLEYRSRPEHAALKDFSATAQQVEIRLLQFCYWPMQYVTLRKRKDDWESVTTSHAEYIRFYNSLWLVANDVIMGIALGSYIIENSGWVAEQISVLLRTYTVVELQRSISWLMGWPAGLKLNTELAQFLGDLFLWVIEYWSNCVEALGPVLPRVIWFIGFSSFAGASMPIAVFSDLLSILTIHIYSFYLASARIFHWQLTIIISLFHLFRGKKHNVLRKRIDSCDYDLDQLLLGTILFTLLFFLLPTVIVFYATFAAARMAIIALKAVLDTALACLNHFPLFALMLRLKDSQRLPGGIHFELLNDARLDADLSIVPTSYITLGSTPLTFRAMFHQYFQLGHRIRAHYFSLRVLLCLLTGTFVPPIHRKNLYSLQYSMLPAQRATIVEMWTALITPPPLKVDNMYANMKGRSWPPSQNGNGNGYAALGNGRASLGRRGHSHI